MPEGLEAEMWRRALEPLAGSTITDVWFDDRVGDPALAGIAGVTIEHIGRVGKVVVLHTDGSTVGLHFGMTGRIEVHGTSAIERLEYSSGRDLAEWDRLRVWIDGAARSGTPALRFNDPRRLGRITIDPDLEHLGVDVFEVNRDRLVAAIGTSRRAIKSVLLDQSVVAGLGNLCADEVLWWARIAPGRPASELTVDELAALATAIRRRLPIMLRRGGSTMGELTPALRSTVGCCPRDGAVLERATIGGRTAVWCPEHQR